MLSLHHYKEGRRQACLCRHLYQSPLYQQGHQDHKAKEEGSYSYQNKCTCRLSASSAAPSIAPSASWDGVALSPVLLLSDLKPIIYQKTEILLVAKEEESNSNQNQCTSCLLFLLHLPLPWRRDFPLPPLLAHHLCAAVAPAAFQH